MSERASEQEPFKKDDENTEEAGRREEMRTEAGRGDRAIGPWRRDRRRCLKWSQETTDRTADWEGDMERGGGGDLYRRKE